MNKGKARSRLSAIYHMLPVRIMIAALLCVGLLFSFGGASLSRYSIVITDGNIETVVFTSQDDPETIIKDQGIILGEHDTFDFSGFEENGEATIKINRARMVTVTADASVKTEYVLDKTVGELLKELNISVGDEDLINVSLSEQIASDMEIEINRVTHKTIETVREIPFEVEYYPTQTLAEGNTRTLRAGANGTFTTVIHQKLIDGTVVEEDTVSAEQTSAPVKAKVMIGDPDAPASHLIPSEYIELDANGNPVNYKMKVSGKATAYSTFGRKTSLKPGCVAMDLSRFPKGTRLYIKTASGSYVYGYSEVRDTGTAMVEGRVLVDLFFNSYEESVLFGAKIVDVYVL